MDYLDLIFWSLLSVGVPFTSVIEEFLTIKATEGDDCLLPSTSHIIAEVSSLEWTKDDKDMLVCRYGRVEEGYEHPDYTNRVELVDPQLQKGDFSVILKKVTPQDSGIYQCSAFNGDGLIFEQFINLTVTEIDSDPPTGTNSNSGLIAGLVIGPILLVLILTIFLYLFWRKLRTSQSSLNNPSVSEKSRKCHSSDDALNVHLDAELDRVHWSQSSTHYSEKREKLTSL